jgi:STE24 endopeptidase
LEFFVLFICLTIGRTFFELWLSYKNHQYRQKPIYQSKAKAAFDFIDDEYIEQALSYSGDQFKFSIFSTLFSSVGFFAFLLLGGFDWVDQFIQQTLTTESNIIAGIAVLSAFVLIGELFSLPFSWFSTFKIEEKHGFNKQNQARFFGQFIKSLILGVTIQALLIGAILWLIGSMGELWWLYSFLTLIGFMLLMMWAYPSIIAPLFNKFKPLDDQDLKQKLTQMSQNAGFNLKKMQVMDGSTDSSHGNAYFTGIFGSKTVVVFDTLLEKLNSNEVIAVIAHELGHFKHKHVLKQSVVHLFSFGLFFYAASWVFNMPDISQSFGFTQHSSHIALLVCFWIYASVFGLLSPIQNVWSRKHEREADDYALTEAKAEDLASGLTKLTSNSKGLPIQHPWYSAYHYSHPPLMERLERIGCL